MASVAGKCLQTWVTLRRRARVLYVFAHSGALTVCASPAFAQGEEGNHDVVFEIGGAGDWGLTSGPAGFGGTVGMEVTPIERWLEIEASGTALGANGRHEVSTDVAFKKPFDLSRAVEFMAGAGPSVTWNFSGPRHTRSLAGELELDFMFWRTRNLGCYAEPTFDFSGFRNTSDRSLGLALGIIIGVP